MRSYKDTLVVAFYHVVGNLAVEEDNGNSLLLRKCDDSVCRVIGAGGNDVHHDQLSSLGDGGLNLLGLGSLAVCRVIILITDPRRIKLTVECASYTRNIRVAVGIIKYVDVCIGNEEDANDVFGIKAADTDVISGTLSEAGYRQVAEEMAAKFGFSYVAFTLRESISANDNNWSGMLYTNGEAYFSKKYAIHIVDRVGGGDSFGGGLIYSLLNGYDAQSAIEFAIAASCLKHSIEGDYNVVSVKEVQALAGGDASGRVQR
jgi:hypothetical protein